jgi:hypothetical protein
MNMLRPDSEAPEARRKALVAEQAKLEAELGRLTEAVVERGDVSTLVKAIKMRPSKRLARAPRAGA